MLDVQLLREAIDLNNVRLTETQQMVLAAIFASATPELAYEITLGAENTVLASHFLAKRGLISLTVTGATLTEAGMRIMEMYDLIDETGQLSEKGQKFQDALQKLKASYMEAFVEPEVVDPYAVLKMLI